MTDQIPKLLDIRHLGAPWAMLKVAQAVRGLKPGDVLQVRASEPDLERYLPQVVSATGGRLCGLRREGDSTLFRFECEGQGASSGSPARQPTNPKEV